MVWLMPMDGFAISQDCSDGDEGVPGGTISGDLAYAGQARSREWDICKEKTWDGTC